MMSLVLVYCTAVFLSGLFHNGQGLRCLECSDISDPYDCSRITTCGSSEECYLDQFVTSGGLVLYNTGCRSQFRCAASAAGKRFISSSSDIITCAQCCKNREFCNIEGCGITAPSMLTRGPICFECDAQSQPDTCRDIVTCDTGFTCVIEKTIRSVQDTFYTSRCIKESTCAGIEKLAAIITGRRRQTIDTCPKCCRTDFCNDNCNWNTSSTVTPLLTTPMPLIATGQIYWSSSSISPSISTASIGKVTQSTSAPTMPVTTSRISTTAISTPHLSSTTLTSTISSVHSSARSVPLSSSHASAPLASSSTFSTAAAITPVAHSVAPSGSHWGPWKHWGSCQCKTMVQIRHRMCHIRHQVQCVGDKVENRTCTEPNNCHKHACNSAAGYSHIVLASGDFCAKLNRSLVTYRHAAEQCKKENSHGHVIVIDSLVKEHAIERYMHNIHGYDKMNEVWIGLHFTQKWHVSGGTLNAYIKNQFTQHHQHPQDHCVAKTSSGAWDLYDCFEEHMFICEYRP